MNTHFVYRRSAAALALLLGACVVASSADAGRPVNGVGLGASASGAGPGFVPNAPYRINGFIGQGQSVQNGDTSTAISTVQPYGNLKLQDSQSQWAAGTSYSAHSYVSPGNKFAYTNSANCTAGSGPSWNITLGGSTTDGTCTWTTDHAVADDMGAGTGEVINEPWVSGGTYAQSVLGYYLHPTNAPCIHQAVATSPGPSGGVEPAWVITPATSDPADNGYSWACKWTNYGWFDIGNPSSPSLSFVPYTEPPRPLASFGFGSNKYPRNVGQFPSGGETPMAAFLNSITAQSIASGVAAWVNFGSDVAGSGINITDIDKGGRFDSYAASIYEVTVATRLAAAQGKSFGVVAIEMTHGEANFSDASYATKILAMQGHYQADLPTITGQPSGVTIPIIASQQSTTPLMPSPWSSASLPVSAYQLLVAAGTAPIGRVIVSGPRYFANPTENATDQHYSALGERYIGEKDAEAYWTIAKHQTWHPLQPLGGALATTAYHVSGQTVTITFDVVFPPLVFDTSTLPKNHQTAYTEWANGFGFEVWDDTGHITISTATIAGNSVILALASLPSTGLHIAYASTGDATTGAAGGFGGKPGGHYGNLRDSDPYVGPITGASLWNWCCIFLSPRLT